MWNLTLMASWKQLSRFVYFISSFLFSKVGKMEMPKTVWLFKNTKALLLIAATQNKFSSSVMLVDFCPARITKKKERNLACRFIYISHKRSLLHSGVGQSDSCVAHILMETQRQQRTCGSSTHINPFYFLTYAWKWFCHCCTHENKNRPNLWSHAMNTGE